MQLSKLTAFFVLVAGFCLPLPSVEACAVCITGAEGPAADGFYWSVLFLMATPYLVVGSVAMCFILAYRWTAAKRSTESADQEAHPHIAWNQEESGR